MSERLLIIDSGIGGLTVFNHLLELKPNASVTYLADNRYFPYGEKSDSELIVIVKRLLDYYIEKGYKRIILACNTASRIYNTYLRNKYPNVYSIIESTIDVFKTLDNKRKVLIIGTTNTIMSRVYEEELKELQDVTVYSLACPELVEYCENNQRMLIRPYLDKYFKKYQGNIDTLILGCTHFNIISADFSAFFDSSISIICSGYALIESLKDTIDLSNEKEQIYLSMKDVSYRGKIDKLFTSLKDYEITFLNL